MVVNLNTAVIYCGTAVIYHGILIENLGTGVNYNGILKTLAPGRNAIKLFTVVIYHHSMVLLSFCVIKQYFHANNIFLKFYILKTLFGRVSLHIFSTNHLKKHRRDLTIFGTFVNCCFYW
jgi:hypothetical protein